MNIRGGALTQSGLAPKPRSSAVSIKRYLAIRTRFERQLGPLNILQWAERAQEVDEVVLSDGLDVSGQAELPADLVVRASRERQPFYFLFIYL